jgi:hypothetical protein
MPGPNIPNRCGNQVASHQQHYVLETGSKADRFWQQVGERLMECENIDE